MTSLRKRWVFQTKDTYSEEHTPKSISSTVWLEQKAPQEPTKRGKGIQEPFREEGYEWVSLS